MTIYTRSCCQTAYTTWTSRLPCRRRSHAHHGTWNDLPPLLTFRKRSYLFRLSHPGFLYINFIVALRGPCGIAACYWAHLEMFWLIDWSAFKPLLTVRQQNPWTCILAVISWSTSHQAARGRTVFWSPALNCAPAVSSPHAVSRVCVYCAIYINIAYTLSGLSGGITKVFDWISSRPDHARSLFNT